MKPRIRAYSKEYYDWVECRGYSPKGFDPPLRFIHERLPNDDYFDVMMRLKVAADNYKDKWIKNKTS